MDLNLKSFDWRSLQKYMDPKSSGDLNAFLEKLPQNAGQTVLIAAGIAWAMAGALGLYASIQARQLTELRAELVKAEALTPIVPKISDVPIDKKEVETFIGKVSAYDGLNIKANGSTIVIRPTDRQFCQVSEAIGHMQNGGFRLARDAGQIACGRECGDKDKLGIA